MKSGVNKMAVALQGSEEGWGFVTVAYLADKIQSNPDKVLVIDSRSFLEYNTSHVLNAVNVCCSKLVKRRLQQGKVHVRDLLSQTCQVDMEHEQEIIVYDQCSTHTARLSQDCFLIVLLQKLVAAYKSVSLLRGGFLEFQACHASLCESKSATTTSSGGYKCPPLTSMSQPAMPVSNIGPTKILPFLYLGSQQDALSMDIVEKTGISYIVNVSTSSPRPAHIAEGHFLRLPVNDNYSDKLLPLFPEAFQFLDKVKEANGRVLIHCLAGISRSATVAIAYLMYHMNISNDEAYKYVKDKRPTISPNFNFLGQLLEFEKQRVAERGSSDNFETTNTSSSTQTETLSKKQCTLDLSNPTTPTTPTPMAPLSAPVMQNPLTLTPKATSSLRKRPFKPFVFGKSMGVPNALQVQSPTTALSRLSFGTVSPVTEEPLTPGNNPATPTPPGIAMDSSTSTTTSRLTTKTDKIPAFPHMPTTSLDSLSFTPCFAGGSPQRHGAEDTSNTRRDSSPAGVHGLNNNKPVVASSGLHCAKSPTAGSKRPLPFSSSLDSEVEGEVSNTQGSTACDSTGGCGGNGHCNPGNSITGSDVKMRSPEVRAKRPLVRPNSIAFSSYPLFDLSAGEATSPQQTVDGQASESSQYPFSLGPSQYQDMDCSNSGVQTDTSTFTLSPQISQSPPVVEMRAKSKATRPTSFENARKSRSLENLLNTPDNEPTKSLPTGTFGLSSHVDYTQTIVNASEHYGQPLALEIVKQRQRSRVPIRHAETHQSSSSISSSGSHNSLHGSLEIIQVS